jgi:hypothetical protein
VTRVTGLSLIAAHSLVLTTNAASTAVLRTAGIPTEDALPILAALWWNPTRPADPARQVPARSPDAAKARERQFVRDLGQRLHVIRHAADSPRTACAVAPASRPTCFGTSSPATCRPPPCSCTGSLPPSPCHYLCSSTTRSSRCGSCGCCPAEPPEQCHRRRPGWRSRSCSSCPPVGLRYRNRRVERAFEGESHRRARSDDHRP